jgi:hypothetical protein
VVAQHGDRRLQQRDLNMLSLRAPFRPRGQRRAGRRGRQNAGAEVDQRGAEPRRAAVRLAGHRHHAGEGLQHVVVARSVLERPTRPVAGDRDMDQPRVQPDQPGVGQAEPLRRGRREVLQQHVAAADQALEDRLALRRLQVQGQAALAAVGAEEIGSAPVHHRRPAAVLVAGEVLDLDHLGAEVGEELAAGWAGQHAAEVEDPGPAQRRHGRAVGVAADVGCGVTCPPDGGSWRFRRR